MGRKTEIVPLNRVKIFAGSTQLFAGYVPKNKRVYQDFKIPIYVTLHPRYNAYLASSDISIVRVHQDYKGI
ncbi:hypothetical protein Avbf_12638 [Armadillidium vulgare]|nr:hypothetical protein Avbf_12638 [Armadillidium vulgare]